MRRPTVEECRRLLAETAADELSALLRRYADDPRAGVQSAVAAAKKRAKAHAAEVQRLRRLGSIESELRLRGYASVAGVDEVGRGALAGPLTAAAVVLPPDACILGLDDSKRLSSAARERIAITIREVAICWHVEHVESEDVDSLGITHALRNAANLCLEGLTPAANAVIVDGVKLGLSLPETAVAQGDSRVSCIAAASILAKVSRDALMRTLDEVYPGYDFASHKGYGTAQHLSAIRSLGLTPVHRRTFAPCNEHPALF